MPTRRLEELMIILKESEQKRLRLEQEIVTLRNKLNDKNMDKPSDINISAKVISGEVPVSGPGLEIIIEDSKVPLNTGENPNNSLIHNEDLLKITNELKAAGAEAISINNQRLISNSEISCSGPVIVINQTRIAPPFEINAIGNSDTMTGALKIRGGVVEYLEFFGIQIAMFKKSNILIPAYNGSLKFKYLKISDNSNVKQE